jgi:hypothetical protein
MCPLDLEFNLLFRLLLFMFDIIGGTNMRQMTVSLNHPGKLRIDSNFAQIRICD